MSRSSPEIDNLRSVPTGRSAFVSGRKLLDDCNDVELLALLIRCEADDQSLTGKIAVACVPLTRLRAMPWRYGRSLRAVMLLPYAFSCFNDPDWAARFWPLTAESTVIAQLAMAGHLVNPAHNATHYYNPKLADPSWAKLFEPIATIGDHVFMRETQ